MKTVIDASGLNSSEVNLKIRKLIKESKVVVKNAKDIFGLASGLRGGEIIVEGEVGDYLGFLNTGVRIIVKGSAGNYVGDCSCEEEIMVDGDVGYGVGMYS